MKKTDYNKNDNNNNNVIVPSNELPLTSVVIPPTEKSLLDKLNAKQSNVKVTNINIMINRTLCIISVFFH